jgi:pyruvate formate lyase activating enzyme
LLSAAEAMAEIEPSLPFIRGVTVSGGECTLYPDFLKSFGSLAHERGKTFFLDTNGSYDFSADPELLEITDGIMLDVKSFPAEAERVIRRSGYDIFSVLETLARSGKLYEVRTVVSPGLFDATALVDQVCRLLADTDPAVRYKLIRYRPAGVRPEAAAVLHTPEDALMERLADSCARRGVSAIAV